VALCKVHAIENAIKRQQEGAAEPAPEYKPIYDPVMGLACDECLCDPNCSRIISSARESAIASAAIREDRTRIRNAVLKAQESQLALFRMCWDKNLIEPVKQVGADLKDILAIVDGKV
jgi:hypothetical protein